MMSSTVTANAAATSTAKMVVTALLALSSPPTALAYRPVVIRDEAGVAHLQAIPASILHTLPAHYRRSLWEEEGSDCYHEEEEDDYYYGKGITKGGKGGKGYEEDEEYYEEEEEYYGKGITKGGKGGKGYEDEEYYEEKEEYYGKGTTKGGKGGKGYEEDEEYYYEEDEYYGKGTKGAKGGKGYEDDEYYYEEDEYYGKGTKGAKGGKGYEDDEYYYSDDEEYYGKGTKGAKGGKGYEDDDYYYSEEEDDEYYYGKGTKGAKGDKGNGKGNGKGGNGCTPVIPVDDCMMVNIVSKADEMAAGETETAVGSTFYFDLYHPDTMEVIGKFKDASTDLPDGECVFTGSFSMDYNTETDSYDSQIFIEGTCGGSFNTITGGTGPYSCAGGMEIFTPPPSEDLVTSTLYVCNAPCSEEHK